MSIKDLLASNANVSVTINVADLHEFLLQVINEKMEAKKQEVEETYLTRDEASTMLGGAALSTLWRWEKNGDLTPMRIGSKVRYRKSDVVKILEEGAV